jgi:hypothetical protein
MVARTRGLASSLLALGLTTLSSIALAAPTTRYPASATHSPMTAEIVEHLSAVMARGGGRPDVFAKIGDSITVNPGFLSCYGVSDDNDLGTHSDLRPTIDFFSRTPAKHGASSFARLSVAAKVGWTSIAMLGSGSSGPALSEIASVRPAFAVMMTGTNETYAAGVENFERNLRRLVRRVVDSGVVPLLSTIPPRKDSWDLDAIIPEMNAVVRLVAMTEKVPFMDPWTRLATVKGNGLGLDGIHPSSYPGHACWLTEPALEHGINVRNLVTLESLDRARRFLIEHQPAETSPPGLAGTGTLTDPLVVDDLPFVDAGQVSADFPSELGPYRCDRRGGKGDEVVYAFHTDVPRQARIHLFAEADAGLSLYVLGAKSADACTAHGAKSVDVTFPPGTSFVVVDARARGKHDTSFGISITGR